MAGGRVHDLAGVQHGVDLDPLEVGPADLLLAEGEEALHVADGLGEAVGAVGQDHLGPAVLLDGREVVQLLAEASGIRRVHGHADQASLEAGDEGGGEGQSRDEDEQNHFALSETAVVQKVRGQGVRGILQLLNKRSVKVRRCEQ